MPRASSRRRPADIVDDCSWALPDLSVCVRRYKKKEYGAAGAHAEPRWRLLWRGELVSFNEECREGGTGAI